MELLTLPHTKKFQIENPQTVFVECDNMEWPGSTSARWGLKEGGSWVGQGVNQGWWSKGTKHIRKNRKRGGVGVVLISTDVCLGGVVLTSTDVCLGGVVLTSTDVWLGGVVLISTDVCLGGVVLTSTDVCLGGVVLTSTDVCLGGDHWQHCNWAVQI
jgi:hypothetical protein